MSLENCYFCRLKINQATTVNGYAFILDFSGADANNTNNSEGEQRTIENVIAQQRITENGKNNNRGQ